MKKMIYKDCTVTTVVVLNSSSFQNTSVDNCGFG